MPFPYVALGLMTLRFALCSLYKGRSIAPQGETSKYGMRISGLCSENLPARRPAMFRQQGLLY
jgi:hypothetical protein